MNARRAIAPLCLLLAVLSPGRAADPAATARPWAFEPPTRHAPPPVKDRAWPRRPLDAFILAALEKRGLRPVRPATKAEWLRRVTFDLIGLPPTPAEGAAFERDTTPEAYARVVDRLLDSPHYGERWARHWLDVARYADDQGNSFLTPTPTAYLYRDWVVRALNRDMPYDEFVRLQVAGDEVPGAADDYLTRLAGLGFQGLGPQFRKGAAGEAKAKADELEDRIDTLSRGILGLTVSCARCHDHKFDPIPTRDYYSLAAAYNGAEWPERMLAAPEVVEAHRRWTESVEARKADLQKWIASQAREAGRTALAKTEAYVMAAGRLLVSRHHRLPIDEAAFARQEGLEAYFLGRWAKVLAETGDIPLLQGVRDAARQTRDAGTVTEPPALRQQATILQGRVTAALTALATAEAPSTPPTPKPAAPAPESETLLGALWKDAKAPFFVAEKDREGLLGPVQKQELATRQAGLEAFAKAPPPSGPMMPSVRGGGQAMHVLVRGNPENLGEPAPPGFLRVLADPKHASDGKRFTRLDLAEALVSRGNPLTARVLVNRVWHHHFGRGIVATLSNFGKLGSPPTHPELLDTLAVQFMESGWSIKWLHREILLSATYRLASVPDATNALSDPGDEYLWRMNPRRLDFEAWRDAMLHIAGRLDPSLGGPSVDLATPGLKEVEGFNFFTRLNGFGADDPAGQRRTLYTVISRYAPNATLTLFDFPEPNVTSDQRIVTTIPQQQLFVLNSPFLLELGRGLAQRLAAAAPDDRDRLQLAWELAYGRRPTPAETGLALQFLHAPAEAGTPDVPGRWEQLSHALLASNELMFVP